MEISVILIAQQKSLNFPLYQEKKSIELQEIAEISQHAIGVNFLLINYIVSEPFLLWGALDKLKNVQWNLKNLLFITIHIKDCFCETINLDLIILSLAVIRTLDLPGSKPPG